MLFLIIFILGSVNCFEMPSNWLNPADLHHSRKIADKFETILPSKTEEIVPVSTKPVISCESTSKTRNKSCVCPPIIQSPCHSYLKRFINLILFRTSMKNYRLPKEEIRNVPMTFHFTSENLESLHAFASSENEESFSWTDLDQAFSSLFEVPVTASEDNKDEDVEFTETPQHDYTRLIIVSVVGSMLIVGLWLLLTSGSLYKAVCGVSLICFCFSLVWNLIRAYNAEKDKAMHLYNARFGTKPVKTTSWLDLIPNPFREKEDELNLSPEYDPLFHLDFGKIVIETICSLLHILPLLGDSLGDMVANFYGKQDYISRFIIRPFQFVLSPVLIGIFLLLLAIIIKGVKFRLPFFGIDINNKDEKMHSVTQVKQRKPKKNDHSGQAAIQSRSPRALIQEDFYYVRASRNHHPFSLKRSLTDSFLPIGSGMRSSNQKRPTVTTMRKGPWLGSVVRQGFFKKKTVPVKAEEDSRNTNET